MKKNKSDGDFFDFHEGILEDFDSNLDSYMETDSFKRGIYLVGILGFLIIFLSAFVLVKMNLLNGQEFRDKAVMNSTKEINIPVYRASILDRFGKVIAGNSNSFGVYLNIKDSARDESQFNYVVENLSEILKTPKDEILGIVAKADLKTGGWISLFRDILPDEAIKIKDLNSPILEIQTDYRREYPNGDAFSHIIGYTGLSAENDVQGKTGIEAQYDLLLKGSGGRRVFFRDSKGNIIEDKILSLPIPAPPLETTIDSELQEVFHKSLNSTLSRLNLESGLGIAINPKNGEILAMVNEPSFDNNVFIERRKSAERINYINSPLKPLLNRAISGFYSPGSVIKPLVALASLHEGVVDTETQVFSNGKLIIPNQYNPEIPSIFLDWRANGWVDIRDAIAKSSNIFFYLVVGGLPKSVIKSDYISGNYNTSGLGIGRLFNYWKDFGFGSKTGIDIPGEAAGFLPNPDTKLKSNGTNWLLGDSYNVAIGQGDFLVTPIQLATFFSSIANGGVLYEPHFLKSKPAKVINDLGYFSKELDIVREGMRRGVTESYGSSYILNDLPMEVAGKTGTPQTNNKKKINAFFTGFGPFNDPEIVVLVFIENAREGSLNALPVAHDVFEWYYEHRLSK
ncbi:MAG: hypothetical protein EXS49_02235 [Candidatus Pacebacteria bacterium]|nr:hypothetical protein [Candidatus Paceibacterota bacterium]